MRKGTVLTVLGLLLIAAALGLTGYNLYDNRRAAKAAESILTELNELMNKDPIPPEGRILYDGEPVETEEGSAADALSGFTPEELAGNVEIEYPDYVLNPEMDMPVQNVGGYDYIGVLSIPSLKLNLPIFSDWSYDNLKIAPCRYSGDAYQGGMVICGHDYRSHFGSLSRLRLGSSVTFTDMEGNRFEYTVREIVTLAPTAVEEMTDSGWDLTLFTCNVGGTARITVRCEKAE